MTPDPRRLSRDDLKLAALDVFAARLAEVFTERRGYQEAPDGYHRSVNEDISEWVEDALTGLCLETPEEWADARIRRPDRWGRARAARTRAHRAPPMGHYGICSRRRIARRGRRARAPGGHSRSTGLDANMTDQARG